MNEIEISIDGKIKKINVKPISVGQQEEFFEKLVEIIKGEDPTKVLDFIKHKNKMASEMTDLTEKEIKSLTLEEMNKIFLPIFQQLQSSFTMTLPQPASSLTKVEAN